MMDGCVWFSSGFSGVVSVLLLGIYVCFFFFFSSRRRHTRFDCDWSSDVCSSDLAGKLLFTADNSANLLALDPATGRTLWHVNIGGRVVASPMTYELAGRQ